MDDGRPVIIDEVNAIPHELLISMNHVLTRKVGDEVNVQQNSGSAITIKDGYGVMMTGNLNQGDERYVDRQDMDPAFLSRVYKIEYDYSLCYGVKENKLILKSYNYIYVNKRIPESRFFCKFRYDGLNHYSINFFNISILWGSDYEWIDYEYDEFEELLKLRK